MSMIPSQKLGNEIPNSDTLDARASHIVFRRMAARTPRGTATRRARKRAPPVSVSVGPRRSRTSVATGSPVLNERRVKKNLGATERGEACAFGEPLVPTYEDAEAGVARLKRGKPEVAGGEIKLLIVQRIIGN